MITAKCECEHICHFDHETFIAPPKQHAYGAVREVEQIRSGGQTFWCCEECRTTCHAGAGKLK